MCHSCIVPQVPAPKHLGLMQNILHFFKKLAELVKNSQFSEAHVVTI